MEQELSDALGGRAIDRRTPNEPEPISFQISNRVLVGASRGTPDAPKIAGGHAGPPLQRFLVWPIGQRIYITVRKKIGNGPLFQG
jgi:hypothetical protein